MKDWECGMFLEWALLSQTQAQMNRDIFENIQQANRIPRLNTQICNTINTLDSRNWGTASSVNAASHVFIHEAPEFQKEVRKKKKAFFEKIRKALYTLVDELNGVIEFLIES